MSQHYKLKQIFSKHIPKGGIGAEIGVWRGEGAWTLRGVAEPSQLWLIDPWLQITDERQAYKPWYTTGQDTMDEYYRGVVRDHLFSSKVRVHILRMMSAEAVKHFPDDYFDWIVFDGDHEYTAVMSDLISYLSRVKVGGYLYCDDYYGTGWCSDVGPAVDDFREWYADKVKWICRDEEQCLMKRIA
jgi:hypothetical protein